MKDVPENELLSAYLDGELTAAEQAEVEQLLESSPAARQLLEEFHALSSTLQDMPQYTLDEDLSEQVLRMAERRILTEDIPTSAPAVPLGRSIFRRLLTRRGLVWSGLAVAVAVMLLLHEPGRLERPAGDQVAMAPAKPKKASPPPSIGAAVKPDEEQPAPEAKKTVAEAAPAEAVVAGKTAKESMMFKARPRRIAKNGSIRAADRVVAKAPSPVDGKGDGVLLIRCDISPAAARKQAFDKLLIANGIAREQTHTKTDAKRPGRREQQKLAALDERLEEQAESGQLDVVYVEATPSQIEATLAGLAARHEEFLSVSVEPDPRVEAQQVFTQYNRGRAQRILVPANRLNAQLEWQAPEPRGARLGGQAERQAAPSGQTLVPPTSEGEPKQAQQQPPTYRALFVLQVVGPDLPAAAAPTTEKSDPPKPNTTPAKE